MTKAAVEKMQLCQIHFYQKIARKKVARVNAAVDRFFKRLHWPHMKRAYKRYRAYTSFFQT